MESVPSKIHYYNSNLDIVSFSNYDYQIINEDNSFYQNQINTNATRLKHIILSIDNSKLTVNLFDWINTNRDLKCLEVRCLKRRGLNLLREQITSNKIKPKIKLNNLIYFVVDVENIVLSCFSLFEIILLCPKLATLELNNFKIKNIQFPNNVPDSLKKISLYNSLCTLEDFNRLKTITDINIDIISFCRFLCNLNIVEYNFNKINVIFKNELQIADYQYDCIDDFLIANTAIDFYFESLLINHPFTLDRLRNLEQSNLVDLQLTNFTNLDTYINLSSYSLGNVVLNGNQIVNITRDNLYEKFIELQAIIIATELTATQKSSLITLITNLRNLKALKCITKSNLDSVFFSNTAIRKKIIDLKINQESNVNLSFVKNLNLVRLITNQKLKRNFFDQQFFNSFKKIEILEFSADVILSVSKVLKKSKIESDKKVQIWLANNEFYYSNLDTSLNFTNLSLLFNNLILNKIN